MNDWKQISWGYDIQAFERARQFFEIAKYEKTREMLRARMQEIKDRWPQHLKNEIIP